MDANQMLGEYGDPIEVAVVRRAADGWMGFDALLAPYATVWAGDVLPRREPADPARVRPDWMNFAGSHYSALVRAYHAARRLDRLVALCATEIDPTDGEALLDLHDHCGQFWRDMGAAVDNLGAAFTAAPTVREKAGKDYLCRRDSTRVLEFVYDRRTQYIHSRMVPLRGTPGGVSLLFEHLEGAGENYENSPKVTDWERVFTRERPLDDYCRGKWGEFVRALSDAWWHLHSRLRDGQAQSNHKGGVSPGRVVGGFFGGGGGLSRSSPAIETKDEGRDRPPGPIHCPDPSGVPPRQ